MVLYTTATNHILAIAVQDSIPGSPLLFLLLVLLAIGAFGLLFLYYGRERSGHSGGHGGFHLDDDDDGWFGGDSDNDGGWFGGGDGGDDSGGDGGDSD